MDACGLPSQQWRDGAPSCFSITLEGQLTVLPASKVLFPNSVRNSPWWSSKHKWALSFGGTLWDFSDLDSFPWMILLLLPLSIMMRIVVITTKHQQIPFIECTHYRKWLELNAFQEDSYPWTHPSFLPLLTILSPTTSLMIILGQHSYSWFSTLNAHYNHEELLGNGSSVPKKLYIKMLI